MKDVQNPFCTGVLRGYWRHHDPLRNGGITQNSGVMDPLLKAHGVSRYPFLGGFKGNYLPKRDPGFGPGPTSPFTWSTRSCILSDGSQNLTSPGRDAFVSSHLTSAAGCSTCLADHFLRPLAFVSLHLTSAAGCSTCLADHFLRPPVGCEPFQLVFVSGPL